jgi:hypothetical protein|tara:strand:- start:930 stop:1262 length:333 start_codon:yes stop_codon:yes gene_type:complete
MKRLIEKNPYSQKEIWMHDNPDGGYTIEEKQHINEVLDINKAKMNEYRKGRLIGNTQNHWQQVAEIPSMVYMDLMKRFGDPHNNPEAQKKWKAWLNDIDNRYFRTGGGNV